MKRTLVCCVVVAFSYASSAAAAAVDMDKGPAEIVLQSAIDRANPPKPAYFPHAAHQSRLECQSCHHGKSSEGKRVSFRQVRKIERCESCHNSRMGMPEKYATLENAAHALCQGCHRKNRPELTECTCCHKKG